MSWSFARPAHPSHPLIFTPIFLTPQVVEFHHRVSHLPMPEAIIAKASKKKRQATLWAQLAGQDERIAHEAERKEARKLAQKQRVGAVPTETAAPIRITIRAVGAAMGTIVALSPSLTDLLALATKKLQLGSPAMRIFSSAGHEYDNDSFRLIEKDEVLYVSCGDAFVHPEAMGNASELTSSETVDVHPPGSFVGRLSVHGIQVTFQAATKAELMASELKLKQATGHMCITCGSWEAKTSRSRTGRGTFIVKCKQCKESYEACAMCKSSHLKEVPDADIDAGYGNPKGYSLEEIVCGRCGLCVETVFKDYREDY